MKHKNTLTLKQRLTRAVATAVLSTAMCGAAAFISSQENYTAPPESPHATQEQHLQPVKGTQEYLMKKHHCVPITNGEFPTSVIIARGTTWIYTSTEKQIGEVFEQLVFNKEIKPSKWFKPVDHGIDVGVLCR